MRIQHLLAVSGPEKLRVIERYDDGRGGLIEIPLARMTRGIIGEHTAGGGEGTWDVDRAYLEDIVRNFGKKPGPVSVYWSHETDPRRAKKGEPGAPAAGNIVGVRLEADVLWGRVDLGPKAFRLVVEERGFYGFSIETALSPPVATGYLEGWVLTGGIFTNNPALDVQFAAETTSSEGAPRWAVHMSVPIVWTKEDPTMPDPKKTRTLEEVQADNDRLTKELEAKDRELAEAKKKTEPPAPVKDTALETRVSALETSNKALETENKTLREKQLAREVTDICEQAIKEGVPPAVFAAVDGIPGYKENPIEFVTKRYGDVDKLKLAAKTAPRAAFGTPGVGTGVPGSPSGGSDPEATLFAEVKKVAAERKCSIDEARQIVRETNPKLYFEVANRPIRGAQAAS